MLVMVEGGAGAGNQDAPGGGLESALKTMIEVRGEHHIWTGGMFNHGTSPCYRDASGRTMIRREIARRELQARGIEFPAGANAFRTCDEPRCVRFEHCRIPGVDLGAPEPARPHGAYLTRYLLSNVSAIVSYMSDFPDCWFTLADLAKAMGVPVEVARPVVDAAVGLGRVCRRFEPEYGEDAYYPAGVDVEVQCA